MNDASRAVLALTNRLVDVGVAPLRASELWRVLDAVEDPASAEGIETDLFAGLRDSRRMAG